MNLYPLDYQLALSRTIRARLERDQSGEQAPRLRAALARLHSPDFGECSACRGLIPYAEIMGDPAAQTCRACRH